MATQQGAQHDPRSFSGIVAPELPIGSPERAALFAELRKTFTQDWKAAEVAVARERERQKGCDLYFIQEGPGVKIGRSGSIAQRFSHIQAHTHREIDCLLRLRNRGHEEEAWHLRFKHLRIRGEWYWLTPELKQAIVEERKRYARTLSPAISQ